MLLGAVRGLRAAVRWARTGRQASPAGPSCSEDCLHLDVWAPAEGLARSSGDTLERVSSDVAGAPVLLWLYGGGLLSGSKDGPGQSGRCYAERGVLFVACNYRVGALGFLAPRGGDLNCGLWDQVA